MNARGGSRSRWSGFTASLALCAALASCSAASAETPEGSEPTGASGGGASQAASAAPGSVPPASIPASLAAAATDPYGLPDGGWTSGEVHLEVSGGIEATLDLPLTSGETKDGSTGLVYENQTDEDYSVGQVRLSFVFEADGISIVAGGISVMGPCEYTFSRIEADNLAGDLSCGEDLGALFEGDPREVTVSGSFTSGG